MPSSLSEASTASFVNCRAGDALAAAGKQYGYAITVNMTAASLFAFNMSNFVPAMMDSAVAESAAELWRGLQEFSNDGLIPEYPDRPKVAGGAATVLAVTAGSAAYITCGELVRMIGDQSRLNVVRLERVDVSKVRGTQATTTRGDAQTDAEQSGATNPFKGIEDLLKKVGIGLGVAVALGVAAAVVIYAPKPK